jgi:dimethylaniline monooxygenase (N-oxide forming)
VPPSVCVIGAGSSGLPVIKALLDRGIAVTCHERTPNIGGLWCIDNKPHGASAAYDSLHINTDTRLMEYRDFPMPADLPAYPGHRQIHDYFEAYAARFGLKQHIRFGSEVTHCERLADGRWRVSVANGPDETFDALVVANGHHWDPQWPDPLPPGQFDGVQIHSHAYRNPADPVDLRGRRVVVVGLGNSAADIATELSYRSCAERVFLVVRTGAWVVPKWIGGKPMTRLPEPTRLFHWMPWRVSSFLAGLLIRHYQGHPADFGLPTPDHRPLQSHPTVSQDLLSRVGHGDIAVRRSIKAFHGPTIEFDDGSLERADAVIWCTGYKVSFPFFDESFLAARDNVVPLWNRMVKPGIDNLFFVGLFQPLGSIMQPAEFQAQIIGEVMLGRARLPEPAVMEREIAAEERARGRRYRNTRRHTMQVDVGPFMHQLRRMLREGQRLARSATHT